MAELTVDQLRELVAAKQGASFVEVVTNTEPKMRKTGNPFFGRVRRLARRNGMIGTSYQNDVNNQRLREGQPLDDHGNVEAFEALPLWGGLGEHIGPNLVRHTVKDQEYLVLFPVRRDDQGIPQVDEDQWLLDGEPIDKATIAEHLVPPSVSKRQQVDKKIPWRTIMLENIEQISLDGVVHQVV